jgi:flagellum-specific peptidoglycan hydrolase FlgJ
MPYVSEDLLRQDDRWQFGQQSKDLITSFDDEQQAAEQARQEAQQARQEAAAAAAEAQRAALPTVANDPVPSAQPEAAPVNPASWLPSWEALAAPFTARLTPRTGAAASAAPAPAPSAPSDAERRLVQQGATRPPAEDPSATGSASTPSASASAASTAPSWLPTFASLAEPFVARIPKLAADTQQQPTPSGTPSAMPNAADRRRLSTGETVNPILVDGRQDAQEPAVLPEIDNSSRQSFIRTAYPYALEAADGDATLANQLVATAISENGNVGSGKDLGADMGFNVGGIQGVKGPAGSFMALDAGNLREFAAYNNLSEGFRAVRDLVSDGRYAEAAANYQKTGDVDRYWREVNEAGYAEYGGWHANVGNIRTNQVEPLTRGLAAPQRPPAQPVTVVPKPKPQPLPQGIAPEGDWRKTWGDDLTPNQIEETKALGLDYESQIATCGIAAAIAFDRANGDDRVMTFGDGLRLAEEMREWNKDVGMVNGYVGQLRLLKKLGVEAHAGALNEQKMVQTIQSGQPVQVNATGAGGHYYVATNARQGKNGVEFDFGNSAAILKRSGGRRWFRLDELADLGVGSPTNAIYLGSEPR